MKFLKTLSTVASYILSWGAVYAFHEAYVRSTPAYVVTGLILLVPALLLGYLPKKRINLDPVALSCIVVGLIDLYVYFSMPFLFNVAIVGATVIGIGGGLLYIPRVMKGE